jgi:hypothetical protein
MPDRDTGSFQICGHKRSTWHEESKELKVKDEQHNALGIAILADLHHARTRAA